MPKLVFPHILLPCVKNSALLADYDNTLILAKKTVEEGAAFAPSWERIVDHLSANLGTRVVTQLQSLNTTDDLNRLRRWLSATLKKMPLEKDIRGIRFSLMHPEFRGQPSCDFSLVGSNWFEESSPVWAFNRSYEATTHPRSRVLRQLYRISSQPCYEKDASIVHLCLWYGLIAVADLCRTNTEELSGGSSGRRAVAVGFDDGDPILAGTVAGSDFGPARVRRRAAVARGKSLPPGEFYRLEGGRRSLICTCTAKSLPNDLFRRFMAVHVVSLRATLNLQWSDPQGTFGYLEPFRCHFIPLSVAKAIEDNFPNLVQFHPLKIVGRSGEWRAMNILQSVDCYNRESSRENQRLELSRQAIGDVDVFFVKGYYEGSAIFVSHRLAKSMLDHGIIGADFVPVLVR